VQSPEVVAPPPIIPPRPQQQQPIQTVQDQPAVSVTPRADTQGEVVQRQTYSCPGTGQQVYSMSECRPPEPRYKQCPGGQRVLESAACPAPAAPPSPARLTSGSISNDDYPAAAQRAEAEGTTRITLQVGPNGRATGCSVTGSSGNGSLDSTACSLAMRRFRFSPATRNGQPVAGSYSTSVRWQRRD
jgi:protein TonB